MCETFGDLDMEEAPADDFAKATNYVRSCPGTFSDSELLFFYARYKQATEGPCTTPKPGFFDFAGKKKWEAWNSLENMTSDNAKEQYIERLTEIRPEWKPKDGNSFLKSGGGMQVKVSRMAFDNSDIDKPCRKTACEFAKAGDLESLKELINNNPSVVNESDPGDEEGLVPLHWACDRGNAAIVSFLLSVPNIEINVRDTNGQTPLHFAASCDQLECVKLLLNTPGIDPNILDNDKLSPLDVASSDAVRAAF